MAAAVRLPITPILLSGAYDLWPPGQVVSALCYVADRRVWQAFVRPGRVNVRVLPPLPVSTSDDHVSIERKVRRALLAASAVPMGQLFCPSDSDCCVVQMTPRPPTARTAAPSPSGPWRTLSPSPSGLGSNAVDRIK